MCKDCAGGALVTLSVQSSTHPKYKKKKLGDGQLFPVVLSFALHFIVQQPVLIFSLSQYHSKTNSV